MGRATFEPANRPPSLRIRRPQRRKRPCGGRPSHSDASQAMEWFGQKLSETRRRLSFVRLEPFRQPITRAVVEVPWRLVQRLQEGGAHMQHARPASAPETSRTRPCSGRDNARTRSSRSTASKRRVVERQCVSVRDDIGVPEDRGIRPRPTWSNRRCVPPALTVEHPPLRVANDRQRLDRAARC